MKVKYILFVLIVSICGFFVRAESAMTEESPFDDPDMTISMDFQDASLRDILKILSIQSGLNFISSESVQDRKMTLYLDKVALKEAMDKIFKANNLTYELDRDSNIFIVKDWGKPKIETITRIFYLRYASVSASALENEKEEVTTESSSSSSSNDDDNEDESGLLEAIKKNLTELGSVIEDTRTNSLIVTEVPSHMPVIAQLIAAIDVPQPQIMLEVEMLDVSKNAVDKMGFNWADAGSYAMQIASASKTTLFPLSGFKGSSTTDSALTAGTLSFPTNLKLVFDYLRTLTDTKSLARPKILTLNNETAEIKITTDEAVGVQQSVTSAGSEGVSSSTTSAERVETGVSLRVTPQINSSTGEITMYIVPSVSEATTGSITISGNTVKDPETRSTKSVVRIRDGETIIIGGLIRNQSTTVETKLPLLGDIPIAGALFRHKNKTPNKERELLVFITPHIQKDSSVELAQVKSVLPEREQNSIGSYDRFSTISTNLNYFEQKQK